MEGLLKELGLHQALARLIEDIGKPTFWRSLLQALRQLATPDNALAVVMYEDAPPQVLEELNFGAFMPTASPIPHYCGGMYLLDPFYQAIRGGLASGLHHLEEVAPDEFRQSEYYQSYFCPEVGQDELQFTESLGDGKTLCLSLGSQQRFDALTLGRLIVVNGWVRAAMRRHWTLLHDIQQGPNQTALKDKLGKTLERFGSGRLSEREAEIAKLTLRGYSSKAVAQTLDISPETVKVHKRNVYNKLGITNHTDLFNCFMTELTAEDPPA